MNRLKKLFNNYEMTWPRLIVFSIICGVYSAFMLLIPFTAKTALKEIGVGYECWFILAIFVVSNCKNWKDAAIKCFIFFLISQPLIYIVQSIFIHENLLKAYYWPWFKMTFLTLPGGAIAYQIKRKDFLGMLVLAVSAIFLNLMGSYFFMGSFFSYNYSYTIYGLFLIVCSVIFSFMYVDNKKHRIIYLIICLLTTIITSTFAYKTLGQKGTYEYKLSSDDWHISNANMNHINVDIKDDILIIEYSGVKGDANVTLTNDKEESKSYIITVNKGDVKIEDE